ncbi:RNA polymerase sigma factor [Actinomadura sp. 21ATH]|uniref:RNA polymerase sigma factor n=1 Tax=Actinomadura sp. 21ATH TaxID=1735444 RepID=UPI0035BF2B49
MAGEPDDVHAELLAALTELQQDLVGYAGRRLGGDRGYDAAQEAIARFLKKIRTGTAPEDLSAEDFDAENLRRYLFRMTWNVVREMRRAHRRESSVSDPVLERAADWRPRDGGPGQDSQVDSHLAAQVLSRAEEILPISEYEAMRLHLLQGLPVKAVAETQGVARNTAASRIRRAVVKLRSSLQDDRLQDDQV